ncbi:MAG: DNA translocase FtsK 4TM domain-containing protein [Patescibacteria group bacterium]
MSRRGRRRKFKIRCNLRPDITRSIISIVFITAAIIGLVSFFAPSYPANARIQGFLKLVFGKAALFIPFLLGDFGIIFADKLSPKIKEFRILLGIFLCTIALSGLSHVFIPLNEGLSLAKSGGGGGLLGYKVSSLLVGGLSKTGGVFVLICIFLTAVILISNISFESVIKFFKENEKISNFFSKVSFMFHFRKREGFSENEVEVNVGSVGGFEEEEKTDKERKDGEPEQAPLFEVIQSMSEPQHSVSNNTVDSLVLASPIQLSRIPSDRIWDYPSNSLLADPPVRVLDTSEAEKRVKIIKDTLKDFGVDVDIDPENVKVGSSVTQYAVKPKSVTNISKISNLQGNLALALASPTGSVRIEAPIPGKSLIGIEVPNTKRTLVYFKSLINTDAMKNLKSKLGVVLGEDVAGRVLTCDIGKMPHLLIAGTTGSGKSIFIHNLLFSILFRATPQEVKFILVDPKRVELIHYEGIPHLLTPVVTDMDKAPSVFRWLVDEMEKRYKLFEQARVKNIESYNEKSGIQVMPYIVLVVDELGDIMIRDPAGIEKSIIRIAQLARATGIHLVLAVQRPSTDIITGLIKANIPCRIAFQVLSQIDSRVIIDQPGAEKLLGRGDMLFVPPEVMKPIRLQGAYISEKETSDLVEFLKSQGMEPDYREEVLATPTDSMKKGGGGVDREGDELYEKALDIVKSAGKASASLLQRKLAIGYNRAARIIDMMEENGLIGAEVTGSRGREVLQNDFQAKPMSDGFDSDLDFDPEDFTGENFPQKNNPS